MGKVAAHKSKYSLNSVALEGKLTSIELDIKQEAPTVEALASTGPEVVVGNYDWSQKVDGQFDGASGSIDATLFGLIGSAGQATDFGPTGNVAGANDPHYTGTAVLTDLTIKGQVGGAVTETATLQGNSALTRATS